MISRREFLQATLALSATTGVTGCWSQKAATQSLTQDDLLDFEDYGNVTILHITDIHAQVKPIYFREPSINLGIGDVNGLPPHITGADFLSTFNMTPGSADAYALTSEDFVSLANTYGRMGGLDRVATVVKSVRASRESNTLLLDGGDTWQGSYVSTKTAAQDMVDIMNVLKPDAMTAHWEFTFGEDRVREIVDNLPFAFLGSNIFDDEWQEPAFESTKFFERGGVNIAVIGQAFPYLPVANPHWMFPSLSFGIREAEMQGNVDAARAAGAELVIVLSHNGFDVDRKMASQVKGIDVILTGHTHDAIPEPIQVNNTMLIASGSNGKFVTRLDLDIQDGAVKGFKHRLIPIFSDVIGSDSEMATVIDTTRAPYEEELSEVLATSDSLLYRRGNFNGTFDDLICNALIEEMDAEIAFSPGFRWGPSILPGQDITTEDVFNATGMSYPAVYRSEMTGETIKNILEDVGDNLFNPDPYYQQGGDMVRVGGMGYSMTINASMNSRINDMTLLSSGEAIEPDKTYVVAGWASVNEGTEGPAVWDVVSDNLKKKGTVSIEENSSVTIIS